jgi:hypothetical protein
METLYPGITGAVTPGEKGIIKFWGNRQLLENEFD